MGDNQYVKVYSGGIGWGCYSHQLSSDSDNYWGIWAIPPGTFTQYALQTAYPNMKVSVASEIDKKVDDGMPQTGNVLATYSKYYSGGCPIMSWVGPNSIGNSNNYLPYTTAIAGTSTTCYDNNNTAGAAQQYSTKQSGGKGRNCAISMRFK